MKATMMHMPTTVQMILRHGRAMHAQAHVTTFDGRDLRVASFATIAERVDRLAGALAALGVVPGDRVATFCWNHQQHLEAYLAVPSMGAILHTLNIRLFPEQIAYIIDHAGDKVVIVDAALLDLLRPVLEHLQGVETFIVIGAGHLDGGKRRIVDYEAALAAAPPAYDWPTIADDTQAAAACYTSGTTGDPKGVVYSHRSIFMHSLATMATDTFRISQRDRILLLPPMFHANAWGLPFSAWLAGADLVMPASHLQAAPIRALIERTRPTFTAMVPTLINDLLRAHVSLPLDMSSFRVILAGGSAVAPALITAVREQWGVPVLQGWGMTETSPMCTVSLPPRDVAPAAESGWRAKSGRPVPGMEVRLVDEQGRLVPHNGQDVGELQLRGPWVTGGYHDNPSPASFTVDGWLRTGDVGTIDERGYVQLTDRTKDVIKSGGEWVSSVELENLLLHHPDVSEVAVIAMPDPRWEERPLAVVVPAPGREPLALQLRESLEGKVARFWLPEYWSFVAALPRTSVGKIDKRALRRMREEGRISVLKVV
jgi:fatty-acyl-CoA synthase